MTIANQQTCCYGSKNKRLNQSQKMLFIILKYLKILIKHIDLPI